MIEYSQQIRPGIDKIEPYSPGLTDDELKHKYGLSRIVKLNANENALGPSPLAIEAIRAELESLHHYPDGSSEMLREAIAQFHAVGLEQVFAGNGSDEIIKLISETFLSPGDEVIMPTPSFSQYAFGAAVMGASVRRVPLTADYQYDVEAFARAVTPKTKLMFVCSPNNPTGTIMTASEAAWLVENTPDHVVIVLDLAYNDYSSRPDRVMETQGLLDNPRVVCIHTFSKLYGLAGLRVGYGIGHAAFWRYVHCVREPFNVNRVAQRAGAAALQDEAHRQASRALAATSLKQYQAFADCINITLPAAEGNFVLVETGNGRAASDALMGQGIMVRPATSFGLERHVRITFGTEEENRICIEALSKWLAAR